MSDGYTSRFPDLLAQSLISYRACADSEDKLVKSTHSTSCVAMSAFIIENLANALIHHYQRPRDLPERIEREPTLDKIDIVCLHSTGYGIDRGADPTQTIKKIIKARDRMAHPKIIEKESAGKLFEQDFENYSEKEALQAITSVDKFCEHILIERLKIPSIYCPSILTSYFGEERKPVINYISKDTCKILWNAKQEKLIRAAYLNNDILQTR